MEKHLKDKEYYETLYDHWKIRDTKGLEDKVLFFYRCD